MQKQNQDYLNLYQILINKQLRKQAVQLNPKALYHAVKIKIQKPISLKPIIK
jgi:hypothetical protein